MPNKLPHPPVLFRSVFTRLLVIGLGIWLLILVAVAATFFLSRTGADSPFRQNVSSYLRYIVSDLGTPPRQERAVTIARRSGLDITYIGDAERWTTGGRFPDIDRLRLHSMDENDTFFSGRSFGHRYIQLRTDSGIFLFDFGWRERDDASFAISHLVLFAVISLILLLGYLAIKRVLRPIKWLQAGVNEVAGGNLTPGVPVQSSDELGQLAASFNAMTERLRTMMAAREHLRDQGLSDRVSHTGSDGSTLEDRINRYGAWEVGIGENIAYGSSTGQRLAMQLIIDQSNPGRNYRLNILNTAFSVSGIACGNSLHYRNMCVIIFAGKYRENTAAAQ